MAAKSKEQKVYVGPVLEVGTPVVIKRPSLWANCAGEIISVANGLHRIKIQGLNGQWYHADEIHANLEVDSVFWEAVQSQIDAWIKAGRPA